MLQSLQRVAANQPARLLASVAGTLDTHDHAIAGDQVEATAVIQRQKSIRNKLHAPSPIVERLSAFGSRLSALGLMPKHRHAAVQDHFRRCTAGMSGCLTGCDVGLRIELAPGAVAREGAGSSSQ